MRSKSMRVFIILSLALGFLLGRKNVLTRFPSDS